MTAANNHRPDPLRAMRLRLALAAALALCVVASAAISPPTGGAQAGLQTRPNIVLITTDDQSINLLRGKYMPKTIKQIGQRGTTFTNSFVTTPLCCPSRASLLTGQYAHNHRVLQNNYSLLSDKDNVLPAWLRLAGYRTAHVGKFLNGYERSVGDPAQVAPGWDAWFTTLGATRYFDYDVSANGAMVHFGKGPRSHVTRVINNKAASLARRLTPGTQPLYLQVDHRAPHTETGVNSGGRCGARAVPEPGGRRLRHEPLPNPPSFNEADVTDKPSWVRDRPLLNEGRVRKIAKRYDCALGALRSVDRGLKQILQALKKTGELDDTVLVFTSDNGFYFGEHRIARDKTIPYEEGIRVPLLIRVPERYLGGGPVVPQVGAQVANIDLAPTFLELAGADPCVPENGDEEDSDDPDSEDCRVMDGRSLLPLLRGSGGWPADRALLLEYDGASSHGTSSCKYDGIRALGRLYVEHLAIPNPVTTVCEPAEEVEFYDMTTDPFQLNNLHSGADPVEESIEERLARLRGCSGTAGRDPAPPPGSSHCE
jgi:N-acetylglucosamine-6-sulfatase